jgi:hypothetical protein
MNAFVRGQEGAWEDSEIQNTLFLSLIPNNNVFKSTISWNHKNNILHKEHYP